MQNLLFLNFLSWYFVPFPIRWFSFFLLIDENILSVVLIVIYFSFNYGIFFLFLNYYYYYFYFIILYWIQLHHFDGKKSGS